MNYMRPSITLIWTLCKYFTQSCSAEFLKTHTIYYKLRGALYTIMFYDIILSWLMSEDEEDALMKAVGKVV